MFTGCTRTLDMSEYKNDRCLYLYDECTWASGASIKHDTVFGIAGLVPRGHLQDTYLELDMIIGDTVMLLCLPGPVRSFHMH